MDLVRKARRQNISTLHPSFEISKCLRDTLEENLPSNVHQLISGKVGISLTRVSDGKNVLVSDFQSKDEVLEVSSLLLWVLSSEKAAQVAVVGPYTRLTHELRKPVVLTVVSLRPVCFGTVLLFLFLFFAG
jgi:hypothetical protein